MEEASELQERGGQPPSIAVVVEQAADGDGPAEATSSGSSSAGGGGQAEQAAAAGSDAEIQPRQSGSPRMARLPSRGQPTCLICLEEFRVRRQFYCWAFLDGLCSPLARRWHALVRRQHGGFMQHVWIPAALQPASALADPWLLAPCSAYSPSPFFACCLSTAARGVHQWVGAAVGVQLPGGPGAAAP